MANLDEPCGSAGIPRCDSASVRTNHFHYGGNYELVDLARRSRVRAFSAESSQRQLAKSVRSPQKTGGTTQSAACPDDRLLQCFAGSCCSCRRCRLRVPARRRGLGSSLGHAHSGRSQWPLADWHRAGLSRSSALASPEKSGFALLAEALKNSVTSPSV